MMPLEQWREDRRRMESMKPLSEKMAEMVDKISFKKIPRKTVKKTKHCILDSISCGLGAATMDEAVSI